MLNPEKICHEHLSQICPHHLSNVVSLPWEIQKKSFFNIIIHILQIIYVTLEENK